MSTQNKLIDAVKTAKSIHDGDYSSLRDKSFVIRVNIKKKNEPVPHPEDKTMKKPTLSQRLDELTKIVVDGFKRVDTRIDNLEKRIDSIDTRLDYNYLKKLPESK